MESESQAASLSSAQFQRISRMLQSMVGISIKPGKEMLVKSRLASRLRGLGMRDFDQYLAHVESPGARAELETMIDLLTTNKTSFFREHQHFDFLKRQVLPGLAGKKRIRFWSAGCSMGQEPYTLAMVLHESMPDLQRRDIRILATDLSARVLAVAQRAIYDEETCGDIDPTLLQRYFSRVEDSNGPGFQVKEPLRRMVQLAQLNLNGPWPMKGPFSTIFCRNVMIYFNRDVREKLVRRYYDMLEPGGYLFIGRAESLTGIDHDFASVMPAVYRKTL